MTRAHRPADLAARIIAAVGGGYLLTLLVARRVAASLPLDGSEAAIAASLGAWTIYVGAVIWVFGVRRLTVALIPLALLLAGLIVL